MTIEKCRTCKYAFTTGKDRWYCKKSLADKDDCGEYFGGKQVKTLEQEPREDASDLMIVKVKEGISVKADIMEYWRNEIMKQKETGVIILPWFFDAIVVPENTEIQLETEDEVLTEIGYKDIKNRIKGRIVNPPEGLRASELIDWLNGYARCQHDILDIICELEKGGDCRP